MQHPQQDTAQSLPVSAEPDPTSLYRAISGMAANIGHQHQELTEPQTALQEIIQALLHATAAPMPPDANVNRLTPPYTVCE